MNLLYCLLGCLSVFVVVVLVQYFSTVVSVCQCRECTHFEKGTMHFRRALFLPRTLWIEHSSMLDQGRLELQATLLLGSKP
jgi:hypothetical protein